MKLKILFTSLVFAAMIGIARAETATANLVSTSTGSAVAGTVTLEDTKAGLKVTADIRSAPPGQHGFHIHEYGACSDTGKAAGGHYNPEHTGHGHVTRDGVKKAHAGDMGNIEIASDGTGTLTATLEGVTLVSGKHTVAGRAIILHEKADDFGQPVGNAGGRIACGIIGLTAATK